MKLETNVFVTQSKINSIKFLIWTENQDQFILVKKIKCEVFKTPQLSLEKIRSKFVKFCLCERVPNEYNYYILDIEKILRKNICT